MPNRDDLAQRILEESGVAKLIEAAKEGRDRVLLKLLYVSGVRVSELCGLKWCDAVPRAIRVCSSTTIHLARTGHLP